MLRDKVSIVTGGASGIGYSIARAFAQDGARVVIADVNEEKLKEAAGELGCDFFAADLSRREPCKALADYAIEKYGKVDILVNVAGIQNVSSIEDFPEDKWDFMISLMLTAPFLLTKYVWGSMKSQGWGRIINLDSIHGLVASEFKSAYVSAKHGLIGLTKTASHEGGEYGITVNAICPAYVRTPLVDNQIDAQAKNHGISREDVVGSIMLQKSAIKTLIEPDEVAETVRFLCSDAANHMTGAAITMDGGWTAG